MEFTFRSSGVRLRSSINHHAAQPLSPLVSTFTFSLPLRYTSFRLRSFWLRIQTKYFISFLGIFKKNLLPCHKYLKTDFIIKFEFKSIGNPTTVHNFYRYKIKCTELFSIVLYFLTLKFALQRKNNIMIN